MNILADVNIPQSVINHLRQTGHDILDSKEYVRTAKDIELIKIAQQQQRIILTLDKDFIALSQYPKYQVATIVIRLSNLQPQFISRHLDTLLNQQKSDILRNSLTIINDSAAHSYVFI